MNDHDIVGVTALSHEGYAVECACGHRSVATSQEDARKKHEHHWGLAMSRKALDRKETFSPHVDRSTATATLACLDCDERCTTVPELARHTQETHGRQPTATERTPVA